MSNPSFEEELNVTLKVLTKSTLHLIQQLKINQKTSEAQQKLYLDLIPIMSKTNQALLKRDDLDREMVRFVDKVNIMQGDTQMVQEHIEKHLAAYIDIQKGIKKLTQLNKEKTEELLKFLKQYNTINE